MSCSVGDASFFALAKKIKMQQKKQKSVITSTHQDINNDLNQMADQPPKVYLTHHNGGRPYKVTVTGKYVTVFAKTTSSSKSYLKSVYAETVERTFVGISPINELTWFSGGHGPEFDGNSILIHEHDSRYVFVGESVYSFRASSHIVKFISPVGNNDVPYPYAVDEEGRYYLFIEHISIRIPEEHTVDAYNFNPYRYYYDVSRITDVQNPIVPGFKGIRHYFDDGEEWNFSFRADYQSFAKRLNGAYFVLEDGSIITLTESSYNELMEEFAGRNSIQGLGCSDH